MAELLERDPTRNFILMLCLSLAGYNLGYNASVINSMGIPLLRDIYGLTDDQQISILGNLSSLFPLGGMIGALSAGSLLSKLGRRRANAFIDIASVVAYCSLLVNNLFFLHLGRLLVGIASSLYTAVAGITLVEVLPPRWSGIGNSLIYTMLTIFLLLPFLQQTLVSEPTLVAHWRLVLGYPLVFSIARFGLLWTLFNFDSPEDIHIAHSKSPDYRARLKQSLQQVYQDDGLDERVEMMIEKAQTAKQGSSPSIGDMFKPEFRDIMLSGVIVNLGQQFCGVNFLVFFSTSLFDSISGNGKTISLYFGVGNIVGSFVCIYFITNFKRVFTLWFGALMQGLSLLGLLIFIKLEFFSVLSVFVVVFVIFYAVGLGSTIWLYCNEILPPAGISICLSVTWFFCILLGKLSPIAVKMFGSSSVLTFFCVCCFVLVAAIKYLCVEKSESDTDVHKKEIEMRLSE